MSKCVCVNQCKCELRREWVRGGYMEGSVIVQQYVFKSIKQHQQINNFPNTTIECVVDLLSAQCYTASTSGDRVLCTKVLIL